MGNNKKNNLFEKRSSKIKPLHIPIPNFRYFHKPSSEEEVDESFIGREEISEQLTNWLENGDTGSYLISGYRGMGKSSFVGKVLNEITDTDKKKNIYKTIFIGSCVLYMLALFYTLSQYIFNWYCFIFIVISGFMLGPISFLFLKLLEPLKNRIKRKSLYFDFKKNYSNNRVPRINSDEFKDFCKQYKTWTQKIYGISNSKKKKKRIILKINLGHEILNEKDILSLLAKKIQNAYKNYAHSTYIRPVSTSFKFIFFAALSIIILQLLIPLTDNLLSVKDLLPDFKSIILFLKQYDELIFTINVLISISLFFVLNSLFNKTIRVIPFFNRMSSSSILKDLKRLTDRIDTTISENVGPGDVYVPNASVIGISLFKKKNKTQSAANVREIETELIQILDRINNLPFNKTKFIIVFDELDKIDPEYNYDLKINKEEIPEFAHFSDGFPNSMHSHSRKQSVLRLLGNMKLFVSSAKAKFIFISGRELYDAYLAGLSDREFAINSIFNGVIYVNSFFKSATTQKNIISKTEEYICKQLIPKKYYTRKAREEFREKPHKKITCDLPLYKKFLKEEVFKINDDNAIIKDKGIIMEKNERNYFIDKVILFLYQFSVYLAHISNGSPKKIALQFEKYIKYFYRQNEKNPFGFYTGKYLKKTNYCLSFSAIEQQSIGFVHYIAYPVTQAIINKSSQFSDKLLVSASFLVDQIYKHHKGGFSRDNIEHIPELLEVYRTPELRDFISSIISFLRQTHVSHITSGLYYYKFRKWVSYEISYFSKISEEISAVFNFTLDESSSVKRHYYKQIEYYIKLHTQHLANCKNSEECNNPYSIALIQLYEILGELHLLDDEFEDAIIKFQSGLQLIKSELNYRKNSQNEHNQLLMIVLMIKNVLKLGLTHECQRTYNIAYTVYCELISYLVDFRYIEEEDLGLSYAYENNFDIWQRKRVVFYHERNIDENSFDHKNNEYRFRKEVNPAFMENSDTSNHGSIKYNNIDYILSGDNLISGLSNPLTPRKNTIISRLTLFEDIQFMYQTILAKLFVLEKIDLSGITQANLDIAENEFAYMYLATNSQDKFLLAADFYRKLGAILYLKNGYIKHFSKISSALKFWGYDIFYDINNFCLNYKEQNGLANLITMEVLYEFAEELSIEDLDSGKREIDSIRSAFKNNITPILDRLEIKEKDLKYENPDSIKETSKVKKKIIEQFIESKYFKCPENFRFEDFRNCNTYCDTIHKDGKQLPCYACNYLSRSLSIFSKQILNNKGPNGLNSKGTSRVFEFIKAIPNIKEFVSQRVSYIATVASTLRGMADIQLSCSCEKDEISDKFLDNFFKLVSSIIKSKFSSSIEIQDIEGTFRSISKLEKALLYYWTASKYFKMASSAKDTVECLRKILQLLVSYTEQSEKKSSRYYLDNIKKYIFQEAIINCYTEYDNINIAEIQNLKWIFNIESIDKITLDKLSNFPDIEELIFLYCELELQNGEFRSSKECYNSIILSPYRMESSVYEKVFSMRFKTLMNKNIFDDLVIKCRSKKLDPYSPELPCHYFQFLSDYFQNFDLSKSKFEECIYQNNQSEVSKVDLLFFLISDSIFCLAQVVEIFSSSQISQFTNSFIADTYHQLFDWIQLYRFNTVLFKDIADKKNNPDKYIEQLQNIAIKRVEAFNDISKICYQKESISSQFKTVYYESKQIIERIFKQFEDTNINIFEYQFFEIRENNILNNIGKGNRHLLIPNYSAEMAIKYYTKALETHTEGASYKEMIANIYLVDDDINNANTTFSLAVERYAINSGKIKEKVNKLKCIYSNASYYELENYLRNEKILEK